MCAKLHFVCKVHTVWFTTHFRICVIYTCFVKLHILCNSKTVSFTYPLENFTLDRIFLHNHRLWWLWQIWSMALVVLCKIRSSRSQFYFHPSPLVALPTISYITIINCDHHHQDHVWPWWKWRGLLLPSSWQDQEWSQPHLLIDKNMSLDNDNI